MSVPNDTKEDHGDTNEQQHPEQAETGHTGHGAASAFAHMISRGQDRRRQSVEADDAAGMNGQ